MAQPAKQNTTNCFVIIPISTPEHLVTTYRGDADHFAHVLDHLFVPAIKKAGFNPVPPKVEGAEVIHAKIIQNIEQSDLVLCDMSALNPNVFFELGIRTAVDKPACMVVDDITTNVPFDIGIVNYHTYTSSLDPWVLADEIERLSAHIVAAKEAGERNPLWRYFGLSTRARFSEKDTGIEAKVDLMNMRLDGLARQISERDQRVARGKRERVMAPEIMVRKLSDLAATAGVNLWATSAYRDRWTIKVDGELPDDVKAEMERVTRETGCELVIEVLAPDGA